MSNEYALNELRQNFISNYANLNYQKYQSIRERVRDCASGTATMKGIGAHSQSGGGNDFTSVQKYLLPTQRHLENHAEYLRYLLMADFPGYTESTLLVALGLISTGQDTIEGFDTQSESLRRFADPDELMRIRIMLNRAQMLDGGSVVFLEPNSKDQIAAGGSLFRIQIYSYDKYVCSQLDPEKGAVFILMDESDYTFNYSLKKPVYENRYRVHALDGNGEYYQAALLAEQWADFDLQSPEQWDAQKEVEEPHDPQFGRAWYPEFGRRLNFLPADFCNITHHEADKYENPMLSVIADKDITIYNADAAYRQTLWLTSQPIDVIYGDGKKQKLPYGAGAVHFLPESFREEWLEFTGAGATAQRTALDDMHARAQQKAMSLIATGSNISGTALQIIQGSQVAPLVSLVNTSGETLTRMLRFALLWAGERDVSRVKYIPSEVFSRMNLSAGDIMAFISMKRENPDGIPLKMAEIRRRLVESGVGDETVNDFDSFMEEVRMESRSLGLGSPETMRFSEEE